MVAAAPARADGRSLERRSPSGTSRMLSPWKRRPPSSDLPVRTGASSRCGLVLTKQSKYVFFLGKNIVAANDFVVSSKKVT